MTCDSQCSVTFPHGAVGWSAVCNCGISWSYSLAFLVCAFIEDADQPAHPRMLIRVFNERSMQSQGSNSSSGNKTKILVRLCRYAD